MSSTEESDIQNKLDRIEIELKKHLKLLLDMKPATTTMSKADLDFLLQ